MKKFVKFAVACAVAVVGFGAMGAGVGTGEAYATYGGRAQRPSTIFTELAARAVRGRVPELFKKGERILFIGDSITHGGRMNDMNHYLGHGFAAEIAMRYLAYRPDLDLQFANRGISGNSSSNLVERWMTDAVPFTPDETGYDGPFPGSKGKAVVPDWINILVGCNDDWSMKGAPPEVHEQNLRFMIESARKANPKVKIVLCEEFHPLTEDGKDGSSPAAIRRREIQRQLAKEYGLVFVPFHDFFQKTLMAEKPQMKWWIWDAVHPTYAGHMRMADFWIETVSKAY